MTYVIEFEDDLTQLIWPSPVEMYEKLGLAEALSRPYDYSSACHELALILRRVYAKLPKNAQSLIFRDIISAFRLLPQIDSIIGIASANHLVQTTTTVLPKQKKTTATAEFKRAAIALRRHAKAHYYDYCLNLPQDILLRIFQFLDMKSLVSASSVCREWNISAKENTLWVSQYSVLFGKFDISALKKSHNHVNGIDHDVIKSKDHEDLPAKFDWRGAFKRKFMECLAWRSGPHRAVCVNCESIIWLSGLTGNMPHQCPKNERRESKIKPIQASLLVDYFLGEERQLGGSRISAFFSSYESDDSGSDGSPPPPAIRRTLPRFWNFSQLVLD